MKAHLCIIIAMSFLCEGFTMDGSLLALLLFCKDYYYYYDGGANNVLQIFIPHPSYTLEGATFNMGILVDNVE